MEIKVLVLWFSILCYSEAYKVLVLSPFPVRSLNILGEATVRHLVEAGHEVTFITAFPRKDKPPKNYREIDVSDNIQALMGDFEINMAWMMENPDQLDSDIQLLQDCAYTVAVSTLENHAVQKFLQDPKEQFDVVVSDLYETELYAAFAALYNCPMVWSYSIGAHWLPLRLVDETTNPTFATDYLSPDVPPFDFKQRLKKLWLQIKWNYLKWAVTSPKEKTIYHKVFEPLFAIRGRLLPSYNDVVYNASLILSNDFRGNGLVPSTPQNFQFIGGFHVEVPPKPLPNDIRSILDNAQHGFIYFSMGSSWQSKDMPQSVIDGLLKVFGELKQTVIWKFEADLSDLPKNVHILKWAPQPSILAHPKCLFFITHGGHLSSIETIHFGVPTIGIPIFFDQFININRAVSRGYAIKVGLTLNVPNDLKIAMDEMLANPKYKENVKELSLIYHDRVAPPNKEQVFWIEHVIKTRGAPHLRSPAFMTPWYQKLYLDFIAVIIIIMIFTLTVLKHFCSIRKVNVEKKKN